MEMLWLSSFLPMSLSCIALALSIWCYARARKLLRGASARSHAQLTTEVAELLSAFESLSASHRRLAARVGMREVRHRGEEQREREDPPADGVGEKLLPRSKLKEVARARGLIK